MSATERHAAMQQVRMSLYWRNKHDAKLREALIEANRLGVSQKRLAATLGVSVDTIRRRLRRPEMNGRV